MATKILAAIAALLLAASPAAAQGSEAIQPDRPDVTNGTHIVGAGMVQIEAGGILTRSAPGSREFGTPFTARVGLSDWLELRVGGDGVLAQRTGGASTNGFGNVQAGAKLGFYQNASGAPVVGILPSINIPTADAAKGLGSGDPDYTVMLLTGADLGSRAHVDVNYGIGAIGAGGGAPHFVQHAASVSASIAADRWSPYAEVFWFSRQEPDGTAIAAVDAGAIYTVSPRLALDGGAQVGASAAAPNFAAFAGVSFIVGRIAGDRGAHGILRSASRPARGRRSH